MKKVSVFFKFAAAVCLLVSGSPAQEQGMEMSGFRVPDYDSQGNMTAQLFGRHAEVSLSGEVKIDQLRLEFYQDGKTFVTVESPFCFYDSQKREAYSDAEVLASGEKIEVKGRGFEWKPSTHSVRIFHDVCVTLEDAGKLNDSVFAEGSGSSTGGVVTITSGELFLDYTGKMVQFEKAVYVRNSSGTEMHCEKLKIPLGNDRDEGFLALPGMKAVSE